MLCDRCKKNEAQVHLHQVEGGEVKKLHLCEDCCRELGLDLNSPVSVSDVMLGLGLGTSTSSGKHEAKAERRARCPRCGLSAALLKKTGRLGCDKCYETFEPEILQLVRALHRHDRHTGKAPRVKVGAPRPVSVEELKAALQRAVAEERYEEAARLRDLIDEYERKQAL